MENLVTQIPPLIGCTDGRFLGATTICNQDTVQSEMEVIPLLGPETGIVDILAWIQEQVLRSR